MSGTAIFAVQTIVYTTLNNDATLGTLASGVYDYVPESTDYPYVTIGDFTENRLDMMGRKGKNITFRVHVWSEYKGNKEAANILGRVDTLLDTVDISVSGYSLVKSSLRREDTQALEDPDGRTRHIVARYRIMVQE